MNNELKKSWDGDHKWQIICILYYCHCIFQFNRGKSLFSEPGRRNCSKLSSTTYSLSLLNNQLFGDHSKLRQTAPKVTYDLVPEFWWCHPVSMVTWQALGNQLTFIAGYSILQSQDCNLLCLCQFLPFSEGFWQKPPGGMNWFILWLPCLLYDYQIHFTTASKKIVESSWSCGCLD